LYPTEDVMKKVEWTKFKIIVPTEEDKQELMEAFHHMHDADIDTDYIAVNQLAHQYLSDEDGGNSIIVVSKKLYKRL